MTTIDDNKRKFGQFLAITPLFTGTDHQGQRCNWADLDRVVDEQEKYHPFTNGSKLQRPIRGSTRRKGWHNLKIIRFRHLTGNEIEGRTKNARLSCPAEFSSNLDTPKPLGKLVPLHLTYAIELRPRQRLESVAAEKQKRNTAHWIWR